MEQDLSFQKGLFQKRQRQRQSKRQWQRQRQRMKKTQHVLYFRKADDARILNMTYIFQYQYINIFSDGRKTLQGLFWNVQRGDWCQMLTSLLTRILL